MAAEIDSVLQGYPDVLASRAPLLAIDHYAEVFKAGQARLSEPV